MKDKDLQLGQLFLAGFDGLSVDRNHQIIEEITEQGLGGVILFDLNVDGSRQNIISPDQLRDLTSSLQGYAGGSLLVAVDQEGGKVCRLKESDGFPATQSAASTASDDLPDQVFNQADIIAGSLLECGINFNLAPVVDLNLNITNPIIAKYGRSYGSDPATVIKYTSQFIAAHHRRGVACCLKHFPGHGSAQADSHKGFVNITDCWEEKELEPFAKLVNDGFGDAVMTAHVIHRELDDESLPATLSRPIITGLLREKIGFDGVIVSDDLQMKAISDQWGFEDAVQKAILAGVDLMIIGNNLVREEKVVSRGVNAIRELVDSGRVSEAHICTSLERIETLKQKIAGVIPWKNSPPIA